MSKLAWFLVGALATGLFLGSSPSLSSSEEPEEGAIELGQTGGDLRYWLTKEAVRQAELRLKAQSDALAGIMGRATTLLGWIVTGILALSAALLANRAVAAATVCGACLLIAAGCCLATVWPRKWANAAWDIPWLLNRPLDTELEVLEAMAKGAQERILIDEKGIAFRANLLQGAYLSLVLAPLLGWGVLLLFSPSSSAQLHHLLRPSWAAPVRVISTVAAPLRPQSLQFFLPLYASR
jgi:hypothetical protein